MMNHSPFILHPSRAALCAASVISLASAAFAAASPRGLPSGCDAAAMSDAYWSVWNADEQAKIDADIEANRKKAGDLEQRLADAMDRVRETHDVLGNAADMDQAGGVSAKRREWMNNSRFANGAIDLIGSGKIRRGANGEWVANGRLSNMNQAILDRLNADENKRKLEKENDKVVRKLDELKKAIEQMSTL